MLDGLAAGAHGLRIGIEPALHVVEKMLVFPTGDAALFARRAVVNGNLNFPIIGNLKFPGFSVSVISRLMDQVWSFLGLPRRRLGLSGLGF